MSRRPAVGLVVLGVAAFVVGRLSWDTSIVRATVLTVSALVLWGLAVVCWPIRRRWLAWGIAVVLWVAGVLLALFVHAILQWEPVF